MSDIVLGASLEGDIAAVRYTRESGHFFDRIGGGFTDETYPQPVDDPRWRCHNAVGLKKQYCISAIGDDGTIGIYVKDDDLTDDLAVVADGLSVQDLVENYLVLPALLTAQKICDAINCDLTSIIGGVQVEIKASSVDFGKYGFDALSNDGLTFFAHGTHAWRNNDEVYSFDPIEGFGPTPVLTSSVPVNTRFLVFTSTITGTTPGQGNDQLACTGSVTRIATVDQATGETTYEFSGLITTSAVEDYPGGATWDGENFVFPEGTSQEDGAFSTSVEGVLTEPNTDEMLLENALNALPEYELEEGLVDARLDFDETHLTCAITKVKIKNNGPDPITLKIIFTPLEGEPVNSEQVIAPNATYEKIPDIEGIWDFNFIPVDLLAIIEQLLIGLIGGLQKAYIRTSFEEVGNTVTAIKLQSDWYKLCNVESETTLNVIVDTAAREVIVQMLWFFAFNGVGTVIGSGVKCYNIFTDAFQFFKVGEGFMSNVCAVEVATDIQTTFIRNAENLKNAVKLLLDNGIEVYNAEIVSTATLDLEWVTSLRMLKPDLVAAAATAREDLILAAEIVNNFHAGSVYPGFIQSYAMEPGIEAVFRQKLIDQFRTALRNMGSDISDKFRELGQLTNQGININP